MKNVRIDNDDGVPTKKTLSKISGDDPKSNPNPIIPPFDYNPYYEQNITPTMTQPHPRSEHLTTDIFTATPTKQWVADAPAREGA